MGLLDRAIKRGISNAVGNAVEKSIRQAVAPTIERATANVVNSAASKINQTTTSTPDAQPAQSKVDQESVNQAASTLEGLFGAATSYANEAAKNIKICSSCGEGAGKDEKFCPSCGVKLPETTAAQDAVCPSCGKQNNVGTKFCTGCGTKLPGALAAETAAAAEDAAVLARWNAILPGYPVWSCGGGSYRLEESDDYINFRACFPDGASARSAVRAYLTLLAQSGFRPAGEYQSSEQLYRMYDGQCLHCDAEHCYDSGDNCPNLYFNIGEPSGGFNYVKPEPRRKTSFLDLFK